MFIHNRMMLKSSLPNLKGFPLPQTVQKFQNNVRLIYESQNNLRLNLPITQDGETVWVSWNSYYDSPSLTSEYVGMSYNYNTQNYQMGLSPTPSHTGQTNVNERTGEITSYQYTINYQNVTNVLHYDYILFERDFSNHITEKSIGSFYYNASWTNTGTATAYFDIPSSWQQELETNGYIDCRMTVGIAENSPFSAYTSTTGDHIYIYTDIPFSAENQVMGFDVTGYSPEASNNIYDVNYSLNYSDSYDESVNLLQKISGKQGTIYAYHNIGNGIFRNFTDNGHIASIRLMSGNVYVYAFGVGGTMSFLDTGNGYPKLIIINGQILGYDQSGLETVDAAILQRDADINSIGCGLEMQIYYTTSVAEYVYNTYQRHYSEWYS